MSGICGIINFDGAPVDHTLLEKMVKQCGYRGPDGIHYWINGNIGFAHLALNATPESLREQQPLKNIDGSVCLTADARVDNRNELIGTLTTKGYLLTKDPTDADLILAAYLCWGEDCPVHVIGDFAFAIWDQRKQQLFCARDTFGVKPIHYARVKQTLCIASEAQQIIQHPQMPPRLDEIGVALHLANNSDDEERTMFQGVRKLPPAHRLIASDLGMKLERYWDIDPGASIVYKCDEDYAEHFLGLFREAVASRLRTQARTIAIEMSGGMDSTSIAAMSQNLLSTRNRSPHLFAITYVFDTLKDCDERVYSRAMASELGIDVEFVNAERFWMLDDLNVFRPSIETPFMAAESLERHILERTKEHDARIVLTGEGGDSLLQGSLYIYLDRLLGGEICVLNETRHLAKDWDVPYRSVFYQYFVSPLVPIAIKRILRRMVRRGTRMPEVRWLSDGFAERVRLEDHLANLVPPQRFSSPARQACYQPIIALGNVGRGIYLTDRMCSSFGLEGRHPFLDRRLAEFIMAIPPAKLCRGGDRKLILRNAMRGLLPDIIRLRHDVTVFDSYLYSAFCVKPIVKIHKLLAKPLMEQLGIVNGERLRSEYQQFVEERWHPDWSKLMNAVTFELWIRENRITLGI